VTTFRVTFGVADTRGAGETGTERALARIVGALGDDRAWQLEEGSEPATWEATTTDGDCFCGISLSEEPAGQNETFVVAVDACRAGRTLLTLVVVVAIGLTAVASLALGRWAGSMVVVLVALFAGLFVVPALAVRSLERWQQNHPPAVEREVSRALASLISRESWIRSR